MFSPGSVAAIDLRVSDSLITFRSGCAENAERFRCLRAGGEMLLENIEWGGFAAEVKSKSGIKDFSVPSLSDVFHDPNLEPFLRRVCHGFFYLYPVRFQVLLWSASNTT